MHLSIKPRSKAILSPRHQQQIRYTYDLQVNTLPLCGYPARLSLSLASAGLYAERPGWHDARADMGDCRTAIRLRAQVFCSCQL